MFSCSKERETSQIDTIEMEGILWDSSTTDLSSVPCCLVLEARKRLSCNEASIRKETTEKLLDVYHIYCDKHESRDLEQYIDIYDKLPSLIFEFVLNGDFEDSRLMDLELLIEEKLFPPSFTTMEQTDHWIKFFPHLSSSQRMAIDAILSEKRRLQKEMKNYLNLREKALKSFSDDVKDKILVSFQHMSTFFMDPAEALIYFQKLHDMDDNLIFIFISDLLSRRLDSDLGKSYRRKIFRRIADDHHFHNFLHRLLLKCSNSIFSYSHVERILHILDFRLTQKLDRDEFDDLSTFDVSCAIDLLSMILNVYPNMLKDNRTYFIKLFSANAGSSTTKLLEMLARVGRRLPIESSDIYPLLVQMLREDPPVESQYVFAALDSLSTTLDQSKRRKVVLCSGTPRPKFKMQPEHNGVRSFHSKVPSALEDNVDLCAIASEGDPGRAASAGEALLAVGWTVWGDADCKCAPHKT